MILDTTTRTIEVLLGGAPVAECPIVAAYADHTVRAFIPGLSQTQTNGVTAVTAVAAPAASTQRQVKWLSVYNPNVANAVVTVQLNDNATLRILIKKTLATGQSLQYVDGDGWVVVVVEALLKFDDAEGNPADVDATASADGTSGNAARRDHRHLLGVHATQHKNAGSDEVAVAAAAANAIPKAGAGARLSADWIQEVLALADLSDVAAKTGTGTTIVMNTGPTLTNPVISALGPSAGQQHIVPAVASDTIALLAAVQTLVGKTINSLVTDNSASRISGQNRFRHLNSMVRVNRTTVQSIPHNAFTTLLWPNEDFDTDSLHDPVINTDRLTAPISGTYLIVVSMGYAANATGFRALRLITNGTDVVARQDRLGNATDDNTNLCLVIIPLAANAFVIADTFQNSGAALDTSGANQEMNFQMFYLGE